MSKKAKNENKALRRKAKAQRKKANYMDKGPKTGVSGRRMKRSRYNSFRPSAPREEPVPMQHKSAAGKRKARKRASGSAGHKNNHPNFPLRPLRKRFHLGSGEAGMRMEEKRKKQAAA